MSEIKENKIKLIVGISLGPFYEEPLHLRPLATIDLELRSDSLLYGTQKEHIGIVCRIMEKVDNIAADDYAQLLRAIPLRDAIKRLNQDRKKTPTYRSWPPVIGLLKGFVNPDAWINDIFVVLYGIKYSRVAV